MLLVVHRSFLQGKIHGRDVNQLHKQIHFTNLEHIFVVTTSVKSWGHVDFIYMYIPLSTLLQWMPCTDPPSPENFSYFFTKIQQNVETFLKMTRTTLRTLNCECFGLPPTTTMTNDFVLTQNRSDSTRFVFKIWRTSRQIDNFQNFWARTTLLAQKDRFFLALKDFVLVLFQEVDRTQFCYKPFFSESNRKSTRKRLVDAQRTDAREGSTLEVTGRLRGVCVHISSSVSLLRSWQRHTT